MFWVEINYELVLQENTTLKRENLFKLDNEGHPQWSKCLSSIILCYSQYFTSQPCCSERLRVLCTEPIVAGLDLSVCRVPSFSWHSPRLFLYTSPALPQHGRQCTFPPFSHNAPFSHKIRQCIIITILCAYVTWMSYIFKDIGYFMSNLVITWKSLGLYSMLWYHRKIASSHLCCVLAYFQICSHLEKIKI